MTEENNGVCERYWSPQEILSHVCRVFRNIVFNIPSVWSRINIGWWINPGLLERWLRNAGQGPFTFRFPHSKRDGDRENIQLVRSMASSLAKYQSCIRSLYFEREEAEDLAGIVNIFIQMSMPSLEEFQVVASEFCTEDPVCHVPSTSTFPAQINHLYLSYFILVTPPSTNYQRLQTLSLTSHPNCEETNFAYLCDIVSYAPILTSLVLDFRDNDNIIGLTAPPIPSGTSLMKSTSITEFSVSFN